jgi:hypothetical protein
LKCLSVKKGNQLMSKLSKFIKDIVLPEVVDKDRRKKILDDGIIETWKSEEQERKKRKRKRQLRRHTAKYVRVRLRKMNEKN